MTFCRNFTNIFRKYQNLRRIEENSEKLRKFYQNPETDEIIYSFFLNYSVVSLLAGLARARGGGAGARLRCCLPGDARAGLQERRAQGFGPWG